MNQDKTDPAQRPQTLLEAAKAMIDLSPSLPLGEYRWDNLRAAIAREEARPADYWQVNLREAEASAAWWKAEGERLSAELALAKNQMTLAIERSERLSGQLRGCEYDLGQTGELRQRVEKAEAELATFRGYFAKAHSISDTGKCSFKFDEPKPVPPFEGDPKACAFKPLAFPEEPKPLPVEPRDPVTGWTFRDYAAELEAAYTVARGNACLLAEALKVKGATK